MVWNDSLTTIAGSSTAPDPERLVPGTPEWRVGYPDHIQRYRFVAKRTPPGARVLDVACGSGYGSAYLVDHGAGLVAAVDVAAEALAVARAHFDRDQIVWWQDDCHLLETVVSDCPFDVVCNLETLEHLREPERFLQRVTGLLKPGGILITSTPNRILANKLRGASADARPGNPHHYREYTADEFDDLLRRYFCDVAMWYQCYAAPIRMRLALEPLILEMWSNPALRLGRWLQRVIRRRPPRRLDDLLPPRHGAWEIVEDDPGPDVTWTFLAVCGRPRCR